MHVMARMATKAIVPQLKFGVSKILACVQSRATSRLIWSFTSGIDQSLGSMGRGKRPHHRTGAKDKSELAIYSVVS